MQQNEWAKQKSVVNFGSLISIYGRIGITTCQSHRSACLHALVAKQIVLIRVGAHGSLSGDASSQHQL
jgi:hypothetical protein